MSRHVAQVAGRVLHTTNALAHPTALPATRLLCAVLEAPRIQLAARQHLFERTAARSIASSAYSGKYAATKDTTGRWNAPSVPIAAGLGLRAGIRAEWRARSNPRHSILQDLYITQRRWKSQARASRQDRLVDSGGKTTSKPSTDAGSKQHNLLDRLPHLHRPTKEELLAAATGFWHRLQIRFKWFSIRSVRPFNSDEIGAFLSWIFWGHVLWIVIGTTTFVSLAIWAINTVFAQETLAGWVGNYLTQSSGVKIVFESAIVPTWRDGVITFNNVFVSRRPGNQATKHQRTVSKGSSTTAAAAAAEAALAERNKDEADDGNYTQFDVTIQTVHVTLSFAKYFNGKGLLRSVAIHGVRGVVDRSHVLPIPSDAQRDPKSYRHQHNTGDFEIDSFKMEDVLLTVYQPRRFRPFTVSVFNCELPRLRKQWLFYDFMSANNMSGSFDESLFTIHPRQVHSINTTTSSSATDSEAVEDAGQWKKHSRFRIDGLNIDHLNRGVSGPFSWIYEGNVDIVADVMIPNDEDGGIAKVMSNLYDKVEATVVSAANHTNISTSAKVPQQQEEEGDTTIRHAQDETSLANSMAGSTTLAIAAESPSTTPSAPSSSSDDNEDPPLILDISIHLNDVRAAIPLFTRDLSYVNNALIRPIVAYINSRPHPYIPVKCRVTKHLSEFDGSWTIFDSGLLDDLSRETYGAFVRGLGDEGVKRRRIKKVGIWTLRVLVQGLFLGLAGQLA